MLMTFFLIGCGALPGYPITTFYVKNNSDTPINFNASVLKRSSTGPFEMSNAFTVQPQDSVLARQVGFKKDSQNPHKWFTQFNIFPVDEVQTNDPNKPENWVKGTDAKGRTIYTFTIAQ